MSDSRSRFPDLGAFLPPLPGGPLVLVRVEIVGLAATPGSPPPPARGRCHHGVESIAREFCAGQPLDWDVDSVTLTFAQDGETAALNAYRAAEAILHRLWIDLGASARCAVHVGREDAHGTKRPDARSVQQCLALAAAAPVNSVVVSDEVWLALPESAMERFERLGFLEGWDIPVHVYPKAAARGARIEAFRQRQELSLWEAFRRHAQSDEVRRLGFVGFRTGGKPPPRLDLLDVFVDPNLQCLNGRRDLPGTAATDDASGMRGVLAGGQRPVVFLGEPGSGKSTLLRRLAISAASGTLTLQHNFGVLERRLPLLASVGRLAEIRRTLGPEAGAERALARYFFERELAADERTLSEFLAARLRAGECILLLDGLDEVDARDREAAWVWLKDLWTRHPTNRFVATSRRVGYAGSPWPDAAEWLVLPFDDKQVEQFVRTFVRSFRKWEGSADDAAAERDARAFLEELRKSEPMTDLARNPLMLTGMALVFRAEGKLYRHRVQTFDCLATTLCETWSRVRGSTAGEAKSLSYADEALPVLGELARRIHARGGTGRAPRAFVIEALKEALAARGGVEPKDAAQAAEEFLRVLSQELQLFQELGPDEWGFFHLAFLDFFVAAGLLASEEFEAEAMRHVFDRRWLEILRLGVGYLVLIQKRPKAAVSFIERVLESAECPERPWVAEVLGKQVVVAALLASEAGEVVPRGLLERIAERLVDVLAAAAPQVTERLAIELRDSTVEVGVVEECAARLQSGGEMSPECLELLGATRTERASQVLDEAIRHPDARVRERALSAAVGGHLIAELSLRVSLSRRGMHELRSGPAAAVTNDSKRNDKPILASLDSILASLHDSNADVRCTAVRALWLNQDEDVLARVTEHLQDPDAHVRLWSVLVAMELSKSKGKSYWEEIGLTGVLFDLRESEDAEVASQAFHASVTLLLLQTTDKPAQPSSFYVGHTAKAHLTLDEATAAVLADIGPILDRFSQDEYEVGRVLFVPWVAGFLRLDQSVVPPPSITLALQRLTCSDPDCHVREFTLDQIGDLTSIPFIAQDILPHALHDLHPSVRTVALEKIATSNLLSLTEPVRALLADPDPRVADEAANTLARLGDAGVLEYLRSHLADPSPERRVRAADSLGRLGSPDAERLLLDTVRSWQSDPARPFALHRMSREESVAFWSSDVSGERRAVLRALWSIDSQRAESSAGADSA